jgi:hypothetical protein
LTDFFRSLLAIAVRLALLACFLAGAAFIPAVQTWAAQWELAHHPGTQTTLGSFWAGFGRLRAVDVQVATREGELVIPELEARLPLLSAWNGRRLQIRRLTAQGWTFKVARSVGADMETATAQGIAAAVAGALDRLKLPCDLESLDGLAAEGDVVFPMVAGESRQVHVKLSGGGLAAGKPGVFAVSLTGLRGDEDPPRVLFGVQGRLEVAMDTPRTVARLGFSSDLSGGTRFAIQGAAAEVAAARSAGGETYSLRLTRAGRTLAQLEGSYSPASRQLVGDWKIDVADRDTSWLAASALAPPFSAQGAGRFTANPFLREGEASGHLTAAASRPVPAFPAVGLLRLDASFDATLSAADVRVRRLAARLEGGACAASVDALEPFEFDRSSGALKAENANADWLRVSVRGLPLAWLPARWAGYSLDAGTLAGAFTLRASQGGFALRSQAPVSAEGVALSRDGHTLARDLALSLGLQADYSPDQWKVRAAPLEIARAGQALATLEGTASRSGGEGAPVSLTATWKAELPALAAAGLLPPWLTGRSASGDCTASFGEPLAIECKLAYVGLDPRNTITADLEAKGDPADSLAVTGPVTIASGPQVTDFAVDGATTQDDDGRTLSLRITGKTAYAEQLEAALALVTTAAGGHLPSLGDARSGVRDAAPFWGKLTGGVSAEFETLHAGDRQFTTAGGELQFDHGVMKLEHARLIWAQAGRPRVARADATLTFDPAAPAPYRLQGSGTLEEVEVATLFGPALRVRGPLMEGRFSTAASVEGSGGSVAALIRGARLQFQLTSTTAILRALGTNVAEQIPEPDQKQSIGDKAGAVGAGIGEIFGMEKHVRRSQLNQLGANTEAVLELNDQLAELGFDRVAATVVRDADGALRLTRLEMTAPELRLTGTARIDADPGVPLRQRPLAADLRLGLKGHLTDLVAQAGLPAEPADRDGYRVLRDPLRLGGSLAHFDAAGWGQLLLQAALPKPAAKKKGG